MMLVGQLLRWTLIELRPVIVLMLLTLRFDVTEAQGNTFNMPANAGVNTGAGHVDEVDDRFEAADLDADSDAGDGDACNSSGTCTCR